MDAPQESEEALKTLTRKKLKFFHFSLDNTLTIIYILGTTATTTQKERHNMDNNNLTISDLESIMISSDCTCDVKFTATGKGYLFVKTFGGKKYCSRFLKNPRKVYDSLKAKKLFF